MLYLKDVHVDYHFYELAIRNELDDQKPCPLHMQVNAKIRSVGSLASTWIIFVLKTPPA